MGINKSAAPVMNGGVEIDIKGVDLAHERKKMKKQHRLNNNKPIIIKSMIKVRL